MRRGTRLTTRFIAAACAFPVLAGGSVTTAQAATANRASGALSGRAGWSRSYSPTRPTSPPSARRTSRPASRTVTA